ncbi:MAG: GPW/gp25 family protein [Anaerolineales bacterium]|nr:GPW/gp25 family protein [Anaerolineales bacterium]MCB9128384.1 GPW/gp25 family protein [Ardenticatenales bacterium]
MSDFLGRGWAFPPTTDGRGGIQLLGGEAMIEQAIRIILSTPVGERVMRPTFGSRLHELLFAPANAESFGLAEMFVEDALRFWEPRIELLRVEATRHPEQENVMQIEISYRVRASHNERSLVYPFYQIPDDA